MGDGVFITGGSGLLGLNWALALRDRMPVTLGLHRRQVSLNGVQGRVVDLDAGLDPALEEVNPGVVVHTAGLTNVEACERSPAAARAANVAIAAGVARACARRNLPLIHVSTDHLFRGDHPLADEARTVDAQNEYGRSKAEAERQVLDAHPGALVVRTNFYGWGPSYRRSFSDTIIDALRREEPVTLFTDVIFTPMLAEKLALAAHDLLDRHARGIVHLAGDERLSKYAFGLRVARQFQLDATLIHAGRLADRPQLVRRPLDMSLANDRARALLGRSLGDVDAHLRRLQEQEHCGLAGELQSL